MMKKSMWNSLKLDSFNLEISFFTCKKAMISLLKEKNVSIDILTETQIGVQSKMFSLDINFFISFCFNDETLFLITMSPDMNLESDTVHSRYNKIQRALENKLGPPLNRLQMLMAFLDPDSRESRWKHNNIKIKHYLLDRFGMEDIVSIEL